VIKRQRNEGIDDETYRVIMVALMLVAVAVMWTEFEGSKTCRLPVEPPMKFEFVMLS
jgi:hypothetical protein